MPRSPLTATVNIRAIITGKGPDRFGWRIVMHVEGKGEDQPMASSMRANMTADAARAAAQEVLDGMMKGEESK